MPNYKYKCEKCGCVKAFILPISSDPKEPLECGLCGTKTMSRRIGRSEFPRKVGKVWAGDWFKKTYGHDIAERDNAYASEQAALDKEAKSLLKDHGINANVKAKRVDPKKKN